MNNKSQQTRNSSIELLRIISILLIIMYHFAAREYGLYGLDSLSVTQPHIGEELVVLTLGKLGVPIFIFITGYYGIRYRTDRFVELLLMCGIYAVLAFLTSRFYGGGRPAQLAFFINNWWFAAAYLSLYLLSPGINYMVKTLSKKQLAVIFLFFLFVDNGTPWNRTFDFGGFYTMIMIYIGARCVRLYASEKVFKKYAMLILFITLFTRLTLVYLCLSFDRLDKLVFVNYIGSPLTFLIAASAFISISKIQFSSSIINWLASSAFAVYLLSESDFGINIFTPWFKQQNFSVLTYIVGAIAIYITIVVIDQIRKPITSYIIKCAK